MHVYTLVELKSNRIGFTLRPLDYTTVRRIVRACTDWDWIMHSAHAQSFPGAVSWKQKETKVVLLSPSVNEKRRFI